MKNLEEVDEEIFEEFLSENSAEAISAMMKMVTAQQNIALNLTKLILEHCIDNKISKEEVFDIYEEACDLLKAQNEGLR